MHPAMKLCMCVCGGAVIGGGSVHVAERHHVVPRVLHHVAPRSFPVERQPCETSSGLAYGSDRSGILGGYESTGSTVSEEHSTSSGTTGVPAQSSTSSGNGGSTSSSSGNGGSTSTSSGKSPQKPHDVPEPGTFVLVGLASLGLILGRKLL